MDFNMKKFPTKYLSQKELACQRIKNFQPWPLNSASSTSLLNMFQQFLFCLVSDLFHSVFFYFDLRVLFSFHFFLVSFGFFHSKEFTVTFLFSFFNFFSSHSNFSSKTGDTGQKLNHHSQKFQTMNPRWVNTHAHFKNYAPLQPVPEQLSSFIRSSFSDASREGSAVVAMFSNSWWSPVSSYTSTKFCQNQNTREDAGINQARLIWASLWENAGINQARPFGALLCHFVQLKVSAVYSVSICLGSLWDDRNTGTVSKISTALIHKYQSKNNQKIISLSTCFMEHISQELWLDTLLH